MPEVNSPIDERIIRVKRTLELLQISRSSLYAKWNPKSPYHDKSFPKPIRLSAKSIGLLRSEVDSWIEAQARARADQDQGGVL